MGQRVTTISGQPEYIAPTADRRRFQVLCERDLTGSKNLAAGVVVLPPGQCQPSSARHPETEEVYFVLSGRGMVELDGVSLDIGEGSLAYIPIGAEHRLLNSDPANELRVLWANTPPLEDYKPALEGWEMRASDPRVKE